MNKLVVVMAAILGLTLSNFTNSSLARNHENTAESQFPFNTIQTENSAKARKQAIEINFTIRTFLWALDNKKPKLLAKFASPQMRADFPNAELMMMTMARVHTPIIGAKHVFIHLPTVKNGIAVQAVYLQDINGTSWRATYMLKRDERGRYGVFGCVLKKLAGKFS